MPHRSVFGWLLAGAFCASVSCSSGSGGVAGFGLACESAKDCEAYKLICGSDAKCVQCVTANNCKDAQVCSLGLCKPEVHCKVAKDCGANGLVCNVDTKLCVDCLVSHDCMSGQLCAKNVCSTRPKCEFTSECAQMGLVCDMEAHVCVTCRDDGDCGFRRVCVDYDCVSETSSGGSGGSGGSSGGSGGKASGGSGGKATGGTTTGGTGGAGGKAGNGGTAGSIGEAGAGGSGEAQTLIDDLEDCDDQILALDGRKGNWTAEADIGVSMTHGYTDPGPTWIERSCGAWAIGNELTLNNPDTTFAFIGFRLNVDALDQGLAYDLSQYKGLQIGLESPSTVQVVLKTIGGGSFQATLLPIPDYNQRSVLFASMTPVDSIETNLDLSTVNAVQFSVTTPKSFKLAVHRVELF